MTLREVSLAVPSEVLIVNPGDTIRVTSEWNYIGPAVSGSIYTALWKPTTLDPHNEIAKGSKSYSLPDSPTLQKVTGYVDILVPSGHAGANFGLYTKLPSANIFSPFYGNIITIVGAVPEFSNLVIKSYSKV